MNQAVCGESAAISIGLVMASTGNEDVIQEMFQYAHETEHEKIIRSISLCLALIQFSRESEADGTINQLLFDKDPILRYQITFNFQGRGLLHDRNGLRGHLEQLGGEKTAELRRERRLRRRAPSGGDLAGLRDVQAVRAAAEDNAPAGAELQPAREVRHSARAGDRLRRHRLRRGAEHVGADAQRQRRLREAGRLHRDFHGAAAVHAADGAQGKGWGFNGRSKSSRRRSGRFRIRSGRTCCPDSERLLRMAYWRPEEGIS